MNVISFGSEDEKIGLGFEMFNTSGKPEINYEDFCKSYKELMMNWSLLLGEKLNPNEELMRDTFEKLDYNKNHLISKEKYFTIKL